MRFLHTADWHLGRVLFGFSLLEDQRHICKQIVSIAEAAKVDAFVLAGDVYDRAVPHPDAVVLLDEVLSQIVLELKIPVFLLAGNHDSPLRLGFASRMLERQGLLLCTQPSAEVFKKEIAGITFWGLPYGDPSQYREVWKAPQIQSQQDIFEYFMQNHFFKNTETQVLVAHTLVQKGKESPSERTLSWGYGGAVAAHLLSPFDYVALGHLHSSQEFENGKVAYSGSILPFSYAEKDTPKSLNIVTPGSDIEKVYLTPKRPLHLLTGTFEEIMEQPNSEDYVGICLTDTHAIFNPLGHLREKFPFLTHIERLNHQATEMKTFQEPFSQDKETLFSAFYEQVQGRSLNEEEKVCIQEIIKEQEKQEREEPCVPFS